MNLWRTGGFHSKTSVKSLGQLWSREADCVALVFQDLYCVRSDLGNLLKALGRLEEAKVGVE